VQQAKLVAQAKLAKLAPQVTLVTQVALVLRAEQVKQGKPEQRVQPVTQDIPDPLVQSETPVWVVLWDQKAKIIQMELDPLVKASADLHPISTALVALICTILC
jgi:hypothetical protein